GQHLLVDAGPVIEALRVADGDELHEVVVAGLVRGQQRHVVVRLFDARPRLVVAAPGRDVDLAPEDRLDALVEAGVVEGDRAEHVAVVCHCDRVHAQRGDLLDDLDDMAAPITPTERTGRSTAKLCQIWRYSPAALISFTTMSSASRSRSRRARSTGPRQRTARPGPGNGWR